MGEELRFQVRGRALVFPGGKPFCLVCGAAPSGARRVWFEDLGAGADAPSDLGAGAAIIATRIEFEAPLCPAHRRRAMGIGLKALGCMLAAVGVAVLGNVILGSFRISRKSEEFWQWVAFLPALVPAGFGVYFWKKKDRGGLACDARREGGEVVLIYPKGIPRSEANT